MSNKVSDKVSNGLALIVIGMGLSSLIADNLSGALKIALQVVGLCIMLYGLRLATDEMRKK